MCIQYTIHWDKTQILKKISVDKINGTKNGTKNPENFNFKTSAVPEIFVFKVRPILQTSQKGVRKVSKWPF